MDKKEIYEHLAKIYLDASSKTKKKKKSKAYPEIFNNAVLISIAVIFAAGIFYHFSFPHFFPKNKTFKSEISLVLLPDAAKINFNFDPAKKETFNLDLKSLNLLRFKVLGFSLKNQGYGDAVSLRVEFTNAFNEKSEIYLKDIPHSWQDYKINLSEFKNISDWSEMSSLVFTVEEWNAREKKGIVYLDNIRLIK